ncbi:MAG TPA: pentapeptide repeat-containing protein, partial [Pyrinomonadaceae bacterium]|nr:pentapeptide repeat-containing protein [Pyrinomonadaceae bacterium]
MIDRIPVDFIQDDPFVDSACVQAMTGACTGEPFFGEHDGKSYCVLHLPDANKKEAFDVAVKKKLESQDFNYLEVWFPNKLRFGGIQIDQPADFSGAVFNEGASFYNSTFRFEVNFRHATFIEGAQFGGAT